MSRSAVGRTRVYYREPDEVAQNTWPGRGTQCECLETRKKHDDIDEAHDLGNWVCWVCD